MEKELKITIIGAGSTYTPELIEGIINKNATLPCKHLYLMDIEDRKLNIVGGLGATIGKVNYTGEIFFDLSTNHNTAYLDKEFNSFKFKVNEANANFAQFNFKPAADYTYVEGDEDKLVCLNQGYETYWDATTKTFRLQTTN